MHKTILAPVDLSWRRCARIRSLPDRLFRWKRKV